MTTAYTILRELIPHNFPDWRKETNTYHGRTICVARRNGITLHLIRDGDGWWTVTKFQHGRVLARKVSKQLPSGVRRSVEAARR